MFYDADDQVFFSDFAEVATKNGVEFEIILDEKNVDTNIFGESFNANSFYALVKNKDIKRLSLKKDDVILKYNEYEEFYQQLRITNIKYDATGVSELSLNYVESDDSQDPVFDENGIIR